MLGSEQLPRRASMKVESSLCAVQHGGHRVDGYLKVASVTEGPNFNSLKCKQAHLASGYHTLEL